MSVTLTQTETTYEVEYLGVSYSVTRLEDWNSGYTQYDVFDEEGELVEDETEDEIITYLEENI